MFQKGFQSKTLGLLLWFSDLHKIIFLGVQTWRIEEKTPNTGEATVKNKVHWLQQKSVPATGVISGENEVGKQHREPKAR